MQIEKLNYMDTESFLNCLSRFCARRGTPEKIFVTRVQIFEELRMNLMKCIN